MLRLKARREAMGEKRNVFTGAVQKGISLSTIAYGCIITITKRAWFRSIAHYKEFA